MQAPVIAAKDSMVTVAVYSQNSTVSPQNSTVDSQNSMFDLQNSTVGPQKSTVEQLLNDHGVYSNRKELVMKMIDIYSYNQLFSRSIIKDDLHISDDKAAEILRLLKSLDLIDPVKGQGKGKYKFKQ